MPFSSSDRPVPIDRQVSSSVGQVRVGLNNTLRKWGLTQDDLQVRNLKEFLLSNEFGPPASVDQVWPRMRTNLSYYAANYLLLILLSFAIVGIYDGHFGIVFTLVLVSNAYIWFVREHPLHIGQTQLGTSESRYIALGLGLLLLSYFNKPLSKGMLWPSLFILIHSIIRSRTIKARATVFSQDVKYGK